MIKKKMKFTWLFFVAFLATNVVAGEPNTEAEKENIKDEVIMEVVYEKFQKNGPQLLCNQESYLDCYNISSAKCQADIETINDKCLSYSREKTKNIQDLKRKRKQFGSIYTTCIGVRHATMYSELAGRLEECLGSVRISTAKVKKTIMQ